MFSILYWGRRNNAQNLNICFPITNIRHCIQLLFNVVIQTHFNRIYQVSSQSVSYLMILKLWCLKSDILSSLYLYFAAGMLYGDVHAVLPTWMVGSVLTTSLLADVGWGDCLVCEKMMAVDNVVRFSMHHQVLSSRLQQKSCRKKCPLLHH